MRDHAEALPESRRRAAARARDGELQRARGLLLIQCQERTMDAVVASPPFAPVLSDFGWRAAAPALAAIGDRASEQLAQALDRLQRTIHHSPPVVQS